MSQEQYPGVDVRDEAGERRRWINHDHVGKWQIKSIRIDQVLGRGKESVGSDIDQNSATLAVTSTPKHKKVQIIHVNALTLVLVGNMENNEKVPAFAIRPGSFLASYFWERDKRYVRPKVNQCSGFYPHPVANTGINGFQVRNVLFVLWTCYYRKLRDECSGNKAVELLGILSAECADVELKIRLLKSDKVYGG